MCGYVSYNDARLQPSDAGDEDMTPTECWERCIHGTACMGLLLRLAEVSAIGAERAAETMGCDECEQWEEM